MSHYDPDMSESFQNFETSGSEYRTSDSETSTADSGEFNEEMNNENVTNKGRKMKRNIKNWQRNIRKSKRVKGETYIGTRGQQVPARQQGVECGCKKACFNKLSAEKHKKFFNSFNALADQEKQDSYLASLISITLKKELRPCKQNPKKREKTFKYKVNFYIKSFLFSF